MLIKTRHQGFLTVVHILLNLGAFELFEKLFFPATNFEYVDNWTSFLANVRSTRFFDNLPRQCYVITNIMGKIKISSKVGQDQKTLLLIYLFIIYLFIYLFILCVIFKCFYQSFWEARQDTKLCPRAVLRFFQNFL